MIEEDLNDSAFNDQNFFIPDEDTTKDALSKE
jgi:hypothetical protein